jgi:hypothetical protein
VARLIVTTPRRESALLVPRQALRGEGQRRTVELVVDGVRLPTEVEIGIVGPTQAEVLAGLQDGQQVVVEQ